MTQLKGTGKFVTPQERFAVIQLFGDWHKYKSQEAKEKLNSFLQNLGTIYKYNWTKHQIQPDTGEIIEVVEE